MENIMTDTPVDASVDRLTRIYIKIRTKRAEIAAEFKEADGKLSEQMDMVKAALLDYCKEQNVESVRTTEGLFYRTVKTRYWTSDWEAMHRFILEHEAPEFMEKRLNQTVVKEYLAENPEAVPPGLNVDSEYVISVRKA
jgi:hypothetical protein